MNDQFRNLFLYREINFNDDLVDKKCILRYAYE